MRDHNGQQLAYAITRMSLAGDRRRSCHERQGAADRGQRGEAAGVAVQSLTETAGAERYLVHAGDIFYRDLRCPYPLRSRIG
jgi:hypothetical protein